MKTYRVLVIAAGLSAVALLGGCASTSDLEKLRTEVGAVKATADQAASDASAARSQAASADSSAKSAQAAAEEAARAAREARDASAATEAKIDRMFKRSMYK
jgi:murein lipoprotein